MPRPTLLRMANNRPPARPTAAQLDHVARHVQRQAAYLERLASRLLARRYQGNEPLALTVYRARAAMHALAIELAAERRHVGG